MDKEFGVEDADRREEPQRTSSGARKEYSRVKPTSSSASALADDLLPHLGDKFVVYQSPTEGLLVFGTVDMHFR